MGKETCCQNLGVVIFRNFHKKCYIVTEMSITNKMEVFLTTPVKMFVK